MTKKARIPPMLKKMVAYSVSKPATSRYPFAKVKLPENYRGQPIIDTKACIGCGLCSRECPAKAIEMVEVNGKKYPQLNLSKCIFCYLCAEGCPKNAIKNSDVFELATTDKSSLVMKPQSKI